MEMKNDEGDAAFEDCSDKSVLKEKEDEYFDAYDEPFEDCSEEPVLEEKEDEYFDTYDHPVIGENAFTKTQPIVSENIPPKNFGFHEMGEDSDFDRHFTTPSTRWYSPETENNGYCESFERIPKSDQTRYIPSPEDPPNIHTHTEPNPQNINGEGSERFLSSMNERIKRIEEMLLWQIQRDCFKGERRQMSESDEQILLYEKKRKNDISDFEISQEEMETRDSCSEEDDIIPNLIVEDLEIPPSESDTTLLSSIDRKERFPRNVITRDRKKQNKSKTKELPEGNQALPPIFDAWFSTGNGNVLILVYPVYLITGYGKLVVIIFVFVELRPVFLGLFVRDEDESYCFMVGDNRFPFRGKAEVFYHDGRMLGDLANRPLKNAGSGDLGHSSDEWKGCVDEESDPLGLLCVALMLFLISYDPTVKCKRLPKPISDDGNQRQYGVQRFQPDKRHIDTEVKRNGCVDVDNGPLACIVQGVLPFWGNDGQRRTLEIGEAEGELRDYRSGRRGQFTDEGVFCLIQVVEYWFEKVEIVKITLCYQSRYNGFEQVWALRFQRIRIVFCSGSFRGFKMAGYLEIKQQTIWTFKKLGNTDIILTWTGSKCTYRLAKEVNELDTKTLHILLFFGCDPVMNIQYQIGYTRQKYIEQQQSTRRGRRIEAGIFCSGRTAHYLDYMSIRTQFQRESTDINDGRQTNLAANGPSKCSIGTTDNSSKDSRVMEMNSGNKSTNHVQHQIAKTDTTMKEIVGQKETECRRAVVQNIKRQKQKRKKSLLQTSKSDIYDIPADEKKDKACYGSALDVNDEHSNDKEYEKERRKSKSFYGYHSDPEVASRGHDSFGKHTAEDKRAELYNIDRLKQNRKMSNQQTKNSTSEIDTDESTRNYNSFRVYSWKSLLSSANVLIGLFITMVCMPMTSSSGVQVVIWEQSPTPCDIGGNLTLTCYVRAKTDDHLTWYRQPGMKTLAIKETPRNKTKYRVSVEFVDHWYVYNLTILNLDLSDLNHGYKCSYIEEEYQQDLNLTEDKFIFKPDIKDVKKHTWMDNGIKKAEWIIPQVYPEPTCVFESKGKEIKTSTSLNKSEGFFEIRYSFDVEPCTETVSTRCTIHDSLVLQDVFAMNITSDCNYDRDDETKSSALIGSLVSFTIVAVCIVFFIFWRKRKNICSFYDQVQNQEDDP